MIIKLCLQLIAFVKADMVQAPLSTEQSVSRCLSFVSRSTVEDSGKFWSLDGLKEPVTD